MDYGHKWTEQELRKLEKRISAEYNQAEKEMQAKLEKYMADFTRKDQVKRAKVSQGQMSQAEYLTWRRNQLLVGDRWKEMRDNLAQDMYTTNLKTASMTRQFAYEAYAMNFNYGTFEAEKGSGIDTSFTLYDRSTVERLMRDNPDMLPPPGKRVSRKIAEGRAVLWNKQQIQSVMTQSILQGESIPTIAKRLEAKVGKSWDKEDLKDWQNKTAKQIAKELAHKNKVAAIRNARTMTTGAENAGRVDSYIRAENMGIQMEQMWVATLDGRTRHEHRLLDGQKQKVNQPFVVNGQKIRFPGDPTAAPQLVYNCRCTLIGVVKNSNVEQYKRNMEAEGNIKGYPDMTYNEWKHQHEKSKPEIINEHWTDQIRKIKNGDNITEADIMKAGKILANEIQPMKEEYINSISETTKQRDAALDEYYKTKKEAETYDKAQRPVHDALSDMYGSLLNKQYSDLPEYKKMVLQRHLDRFGITLDIADSDYPIDILQKLTEKYNDAAKRNGKAYNDYYDARNKLNGSWTDYANGLKAKLSEVRSMGIGTTDIKSHLSGNREMKKIVTQAYEYYPTDWVVNSAKRGKLTVKKVNRGYYNDWENVIAISGDGDAYSLATAIHELGHRYERSQDLNPQEKEFYERRTAGEPLQWLGKDGGNYRRDEMSRFDNFVNAYMGKDYHGTAYELCSMGFEYAYSKPEKLAQDPDMEEWVLGMLAIC